jgi:Ca2+:H+ antiporter
VDPTPKLEGGPPTLVDSNMKALNENLIDSTEKGEAGGEEEEEEKDMLGFHYALFWLGVITVLIAILSDALASTIQDAASSCGISGVFLSVIVLPIIGNAAEHAGAVMFAVKNKLDLSLGIAIGSSTQIAVLVIPLLVVIGWCGDYDLSLDFGSYEAFTLLLTVIAVTFAIKDGTSNWLMGLVLVFAYFVISAGFWAHYDQSLD